MVWSVQSPAYLRAGAALATAAFALAFAPAHAAPAPPSEAQSIELGRALALRNCGMCHAVGEKDLSANRLAPPFRDLDRRLDVDQLGEGLAAGILTSHPAMPEFRFEPHEVVAIVRYLRSVRARSHVEAPGAPPPG